MKIGNTIDNVEIQDEFTTTGEIDTGFAAMCRLLGGIFEDNVTLVCKIPVYRRTIRHGNMEPEEAGDLYLEAGRLGRDKKNLRVQFLPKNGDVVINFGNFEVGTGTERLEFVCNVTEKDNQVDVSCRSKNGKFQIRTHKYRLYWRRFSPPAGSTIEEEVGTFVYEVGVGSIPSKAIGKRQDNYVWVVPVM